MSGIDLSDASSTSSLSSIFPQSTHHHYHSRSLSDESAASSAYEGFIQSNKHSFVFPPTSSTMNLIGASNSSSTDSALIDDKKRKASPNLDDSHSLSPAQKLQDGTGAASDSSDTSPLGGGGGNDSGEGSASRLAHKKSFSQQTKRIKTARACDSCRRKKIRCDVIDDGGPITGNVNNGNGGLTCAHCKQYGFGEPCKRVCGLGGRS